MQFVMRRVVLLSAMFACVAVRPVPAQTGEVDPDTIRAGRFDSGKMWTFEYPPVAYFTETYGFNADEAWFQRARQAALRIPGCSAAFVSPNGLIVTNHHCVRGRVVSATRPGETLLDSGFYAKTLADERRIANFVADQITAIHDVSAEVLAASDRAPSDAERASARSAAIAAIRTRLHEQYRNSGDSVFVQVVSLYAGGRYSAYVFKRYTDVRLVFAVELQAGFFGGDSDNFTYPRYALDFAFLRAYGADGKPALSPSFFKWSTDGVQEDDVVFVIGNPGPTTRMNAVAQLEFIRDVQVPVQINVLQQRWQRLNEELPANLATPDAAAIRNEMFGISNTLKGARGRMAALNDAVILARRGDAERQFREAVSANPALQANYGNVLEQLADVQRRKRDHANAFAAAYQWGVRSAVPTVIRRAQLSLELRKTGLSADSARALQDSLAATTRRPAPVERALLRALLDQWATYLGGSDTTFRALARDTSFDDEKAQRAVAAFTRATSAYQAAWPGLLAEESEGNARLGRARFEIYGTAVAPDASSSPRITDGVVKRYDFNGTIAPPYTTFYGMYDRYSAFGPGSEWDLPKRWLPKPSMLDAETPLNFISTADTYGGNSGSPAVTRSLELVGLNFDRNINGLSRDYVYLPERGRNIMVDVRAIAESLDAVYDAHRVLQEIATGRIYDTEAQADAARRR